MAGITHDVNTPIGIGVTATSFLQERLNQLEQSLEKKNLTQSQLQQFIAESNESLTLLDNNLKRASELIGSFKQVAVDQTSEATREINLREYLTEVIQSLHPKLKKPTTLSSWTARRI